MRYGFIGLGHLGEHLARSLVQHGFTVTVHDLQRSAAEPLIAAGAAWGDSPRQVGEGSDAVITCLPSSAASTAVVTGRDGVIEGLRAGGAWIEMSTNSAEEIRRISALLRDKGIDTLEVPVTGGVHKARVGEMTALVGGDKGLFEAHRPAIQVMCGEIFHMGPLGSGSLIKVITNMLACAHTVLLGEALMLAKQGGLDLAQVFHAIRASSGTSFVHETESQVILNGSYNIGWTMDLARKDIGFAVAHGREFGVPLEVSALVEQIFIRAHSQYGGHAWSSQVVKLLEDALGTDLRAPGFPDAL